MSDSVETNQDGEEKSEKDRDAAVIKECRERLAWAIEYESDNRIQGIDDLEFLAGNQWPEDVKRMRDMERRPCMTINTLPTFLHQITNDQRMNKGAIKVHPVDDGADVETAKVIQGLIRHIEYASNADVAYDTSVGSAAANGFGYFRLVTEYESDTSFNQEIRFKRVRNPMTVYFGPHEEADGSDVKWVVISVKMRREEYEREYPDADMAGFDAMSGLGDWADWIDDMDVRVAEYYRIKSEECTIVLLSNGESGYKDKLVELPAGVQIVKERKGSRSTVEWFKLSAVEILEEAVIKCKWIPVFPVYGDELDVNGKVIRSGLVRHAKDPVRMHNFWMTSATEEVAMRNKTPYIGAEGQFEGHPEWNDANNVPYAYLEYKQVALEGHLAPAPQRQPMADIPSGTLAMVAQTKQNIKDTLGMFNAAVGERGSATSGRQELAQQKESDVGNFHYTDNLNRARNHAGRCIIDMLPSYYDTQRAVRMLGDDEAATYATINQPNAEQKPSKDGQIREVLNNVCAGKYDVTVTSGPSFSTQRMEAAEYLTRVAQAAKDPVSSQVATYLAIRNSDIPGADQAAKMLKKALPPQIVEADEEGGDEPQPMVQTPEGPIPVDQAGQVIAQMGKALQGANQVIEKSKVDEVENKKRELDIKDREANTKQYQAETARKTADADLIRASAEAAGTDERLLLVAQSAAKEAVSLVGQIHLEAGHPAMPAEGVAPPMQPSPEAPIGMPA